MSWQPYLLFDAGGTLVFPDYALITQVAHNAGLEVNPEVLAAAHAKLFRDFDEFIAQNRRFPEIKYYPDLFNLVTDQADTAQAAAELAQEYDRQQSLWTATTSWVHETLERLCNQGYRMSIISNSDGRVENILQDLDLREYFEIVIDSHIVGIEKPDPRIFKLALETLNIKPHEAVYIGDMYYIDVWGANRAGVAALHLDLTGLYGDYEGVHLPSVRELPDWLAQMGGQVQQDMLFPALDFEMM